MLHKAMLAFWKSGYETTSVVDLTTAMGIPAPSLYAAFGDKRTLFLEAVEMYAGNDAQRADAIAQTESARAAASAMLMACATLYTGQTTPPGCLLASSTASGSDEHAETRAAVTAIRIRGRQALRRRIEEDVEAGILPRSTDAAALANLVFAVAQGISTLARDGASKAELESIARQTMAAWPSMSSGQGVLRKDLTRQHVVVQERAP